MSYRTIIAASAASLALAAAKPVGSGGETFEGGVPRDPRDREPIPDRVSLDQDSPFFFPGYAMLNVRINGRDSTQVVEFCKSEGWAKLCLRNGQGRMKRDAYGKPLTTTVVGTIQPYWRDQPLAEVAVVRPAAEVVEERQPRGERPAVSREVARRLRQQARQAEKRAARRHG